MEDLMHSMVAVIQMVALQKELFMNHTMTQLEK
jgi:hypothetical protein